VLVKDAIADLKRRYPTLLIMAGNVCTSEGVQFLIDCGADCIKVGVGNGSICSTRMKTGCGVPQLSALMDCFSVAKKSNIPIIGDGGHSGKVGNIFKAIALGGASACMLGRFLAGTTESPGDIIMKDGKRVKVIRGMASYTANMNRSKASNRLNIEGTEGIVPYKGDVKGVLDEIEDGLKSGMSYLGCTTIGQLRSEFDAGKIKYSVMTKSGQDESGYHDIHVI
jgi:IMP dehydrogenase